MFCFRQGSGQNKAFPGKLTQIKEFPIEKSNQQPYKLQKALIDQKIVPCINVRYHNTEFFAQALILPNVVKLTRKAYSSLTVVSYSYRYLDTNVFCRPYVFHDLMMSLPDFVKHFFPDLPLEKSREMLQEILKVNVIGIFSKYCSSLFLVHLYQRFLTNVFYSAKTVVIPGCSIQGKHRPPGGFEDRGQVRGV